MATGTTTNTSLTTETLQQFLAMVGKVDLEMTRAIRMSNVTPTFNQETVRKAITAFWLSETITEVAVVYVNDGVKLCEYRYNLVFRPGGGMREYGSDVPVTVMPPGTVARVIVYKNPHADPELVSAVFAQYGYRDIDPIDEPDDMEAQTYGAFASSDGSFGITRTRRISRGVMGASMAEEDRYGRY